MKMDSIKDDPAYQWIKKLQCIPLEQNKNLKEILSYEGVSFWWFVENFIFISIYYTKRYRRYEKKYSFLRYVILFAKPLFQYILGNFIALFFSKYKKIYSRNDSKKKVLFISYDNNWRVNSNPEIKIPKKDIEFGEIIERLNKKNINLIALHHDTKNNLVDIGTLLEKIKYQPGLWKPIETYLNFSIVIKTLRSIKHFEEVWKKLKTNDKFKDSLKFKNSEENSKMLLDEFDLCFQYYVPKSLLYLEIIKKAISVEKPNLIVITCEYGSTIGNLGLFAGKIMNVPVLAIQHGITGPFHPGYIYIEDEVSTGIGDITKRPVADKTAVFGPYDKRILTELSSYPEYSVVVTGKCSYDILPRANEVFDREKTFEKLNLDKNKKLIVWTTSSHGYTKEANEKMFYGVYKAFKKLSDDVQLVIKLHPNEFDTSIHKKIAEEIGINPVIIKDIDIYEILYASDLMLTESSTTGIEAAILNKPVVTIHFEGCPDTAGYAKEGIALDTYKEEDLIINMKKGLYDKETREKLKKAREKFVYERAYKQDGKATERVCDLIEEMIENANKDEKHIRK